MFYVVCRKHQEKLKKMSGFTEVFIQRSGNFKTSSLSDHDKSKMLMPAANKDKYIKHTKPEEQYSSTPVSMSIPNNTPILRWFNCVQTTEKAGLIKVLEVAYFT